MLAGAADGGLSEQRAVELQHPPPSPEANGNGAAEPEVRVQGFVMGDAVS